MFLRHEACGKCGSSDGKAIYADSSSYCFVCHHYQPSSLSGYVNSSSIKEVPPSIKLPDDCSYEYPPHILEWVYKYSITVEELISNDVVYSKSRNQLIFKLPDASNQSPCWQARNFSESARTKYYTQGEKEKCFPIYGRSDRNADTGLSTTEECRPLRQSRQPILVIVEDCISAIKIARQWASMPCLGSSLSRSKLTALRALVGPSTRFVVWLDSNMYDKAQQIAQRLRLLGSKAYVVWTNLDPKCYDDKMINEIVTMSRKA